MNKYSIYIFILLVVIGLLSACTIFNNAITQAINPTTEVNKINPCPMLPTTFTKEDLIGTWIARYSVRDKDTLILKDDGTYKQIYDDPDAGQRYESSWQEWSIETRESGYIRLHMKGMRRFGELSVISNRDGGGIDPTLFTAIDYCENMEIEMPHEIVLIVTGTTINVPRGIVLRQTRLAGTEWTWSFQLQADQ